MKIDRPLIKHLAKLSKLEFNDQQLDTFVSDFEQIVNYVDTINDIDLTDVEPLVYINESYQQGRRDIVEHTISKEDALNNAPHKDTDYFRVPKVIK